MYVSTLLTSFQYSDGTGSVSWQIQCLDFHLLRYSERDIGLMLDLGKNFYSTYTFQADSWKDFLSNKSPPPFRVQNRLRTKMRSHLHLMRRLRIQVTMFTLLPI